MPKISQESAINCQYLHAFHLCGIASSSRLYSIYRTFKGNLQEAFRNNSVDLRKILGEGFNGFTKEREKLDILAAWTKLQTEGIQMVAVDDPAYPALLREIHDPPIALYYRGLFPRPELICVALVGSRKCSTYGIQVTADLNRALAGLPVCVVSGLAFGIDANAHQSAIENNLSTCAVLGSGVDHYSIYPRAHRGLAKNILTSGGALISELPPGTAPLPMHFPMRNRIIAGLCRSTVVIEAAAKSGALITADFARDEGREVYAVPGSIFNPYSVGPNRLLNQGAHPINDVAEFIREHFGKLPLASTTRPIAPLSATELLVYKNLDHNPKSFGTIHSQLALPTSTLNSALSSLELVGLIAQLPGNFYQINGKRLDTP